MRRTPLWLRRLVVGGVSVLTAGGASLVALASSASANPTFTLQRLAGPNRYATAAAIAEETFAANGSKTVVMASGTNFPDALAGAYLAGLDNAPILLTDPSVLPPETLAALKALKAATTVVIVGGATAVTPAVTTTLTNNGFTVTNVAGPTRYDTMQAIDTQNPAKVGTVGGATTGILATGNNFPDALGAGPLAFGHNFPIVLTDGSQTTVTAQALAVIKTDKITHLIEVGGSAAINPAQLTQLTGMGITIDAESGPDRSATSAALANDAINLGLVGNTHLNIANGFDPDVLGGSGLPAGFTPDALAGAPHGGAEGAPTLITLSPTSGGSVGGFISAHAFTLANGHIFGGTAAVSDALAQSFETAAGNAAAPIPTTFGVPATPVPTLGGGGNPPVGVTGAPVLIGASIVTNNFGSIAGNSIVRYTFNKPVSTFADLTDYSLDGFNSTATPIHPTIVNVDPADQSSVLAQYPFFVDVASYTLAVVGNDSLTTGAVKGFGASTNANPLGAVPLGGSTASTNAGQTAGPDLISAVVGPGPDQITYTFDKAFTVAVTATSFGFYNSVGTPFMGTSAVLAVDQKSVTINFAPADQVSTTAVRFFVKGIPVAPAVFSISSGKANPIGAVGGATTHPDLTGVTVDPAGPRVLDFTFDRSVLPAVVAADFFAYSSDDTATAAVSAVQTSTTTVQVTFPAGVNNIVLGGVIPGATHSSAADGGPAGLINTYGSAALGSSITASPGVTSGPDLVSANANASASQVTFNFDKVITTVTAGGFFVLAANGTATFGIAPAGTPVINGKSVTVTFPAGSVNTAVGAGVTSPVGEESSSTTTAATSAGVTANAPGSVAIS